MAGKTAAHSPASVTDAAIKASPPSALGRYHLDYRLFPVILSGHQQGNARTSIAAVYQRGGRV
jgi:hypothetical protein